MFKFFAQVWGRTWESWRRTPIIQRTLLFCQNIALLIRSSLQSLWRAQLPRIAFLVLSTMIVGGLVVLGIERHHNEQFKDVEDALWWALITVTTTGYGDKFPITGWGRIVTGLLIFTEMGLVSVFTATIASALTERRLKEARGLGKITSVGHIAICGWNPNADNLIGKLTEVGHTEDIVLVNTLSEEVVQDVILRHPDASIRFVRGDFSMESTRKFSEAGKEALFHVGGGTQVQVNPPDDYVIEPDDRAVVITLEKENQP